MASQFVKAYCDISKQYYGIKVDDYQKSYLATDFYDITIKEGKILASTIDAHNLHTADILKPCFVCKSRKISGCTCAKPLFQCKEGMGYRFQCIYCTHLHVYSQEEGNEVDEGLVGNKITLTQGQVVEISAAGATALKQIRVGVGWKEAVTGNSMDIDVSVVAATDSGERELIFYNNKRHKEGAIIHHGDNLKGGTGNGPEGDSENIDVFLPMLPYEQNRLIFILNIYRGQEKHQTFRDVRDMYIRLTDATSNKVLAMYSLEQRFSDKTGIVIGIAYRENEKWYFKAIGDGVYASTVQQMAIDCVAKYR